MVLNDGHPYYKKDSGIIQISILLLDSFNFHAITFVQCKKFFAYIAVRERETG